MKIAYLDILYDGSDAFEDLAAELNRHAPRGVSVDYHFITGADNLEYIVFEELVLYRLIVKINDLRKENYDAVIIGCFHDPAIDAARELFDDIIIAGPGESSVQLASIFGKCFSVISVRHKTTEKMLENIHRSGLDSKLRSVRPLGIRVSDLQKDHSLLEQRISEEISLALEKDGAEVIILGCTMETGQYQALQKKFGVPVIDPAIAAMMNACMQYNCKTHCGWTYSRRCTFERPPAEEIRKYLKIEI